MKKSGLILVLVFLVTIFSVYSLVPDLDEDGVSDENDKCPNSQNDAVDMYGCDCTQKTAAGCSNNVPADLTIRICCPDNNCGKNNMGEANCNAFQRTGAAQDEGLATTAKPTRKQDETFFSMYVKPGTSNKSNISVLYFDNPFIIDTKELSEQIQAAGQDVIYYDENKILIGHKSSQKPFILTKRGSSKIEYTTYDGFIVELEEQPVLVKAEGLMNEIQETRNSLNNIDTSGFLGFFKIPSKFFTGRRLNGLEKNFENNLRTHTTKITSEQVGAKQEIRSLLGPSRASSGFGSSFSGTDTNFGENFKNTFNGFVVKGIDSGSANSISELKSVKRVSLNFQVKANLMDSAELINADKLWDGGYTGRGVTIAVIDTGVDYTHPDLGGCLGGGCKVVGGYDFVNDDNDPMDDQGHGTHCAATAAGDGELKGVAPGAKIYAYKVLDSGGSGNADDIIAAIERAVDPNNDGDFSDHVDVISMSLGGSGNPDDPMSQAVDNAVDAGVIAVIAAGNSGPWPGSIGSPGTARNAITVGASCKPSDVGNNQNCEGELADFSSRGPVEWEGGTLIKPDIVAPGVNICAAQYDSVWDASKCLDDKHVAISGTSMATPHVAGAAALLIQAHPEWPPEVVKGSLMLTAKDLGFEVNAQGMGLIDLQRANEVKLLTNPLVLDFGRIIDKLPEPQKLSILNMGDKTIKLTLTVKSNIIQLDKKEVVVAPDSVETVTVSITGFSKEGGAISGEISLSDGSKGITVPYTFWSGSELAVSVKTGRKGPVSDVSVAREDLSVIEGKFSHESIDGKTYFYVPPGKYGVYAVGDVEDFKTLEYLLMDVVEVPNHKRLSVELDIANARPFKIKAKAKDGTKLLLYEWQKAFRVYNGKGCHLTYDFMDPAYGDRTVYVSNKPDMAPDVDVFFKYEGVPSQVVPEEEEPSISRGFSWKKCGS